MPEIRILPDKVANQIAAGEVVERPAAVVKELLENALDAGATRVTVEFRNGGKSFIAVEDNGHGMTPDQALMALEMHATSKIRTADDLNEIRTFGFRGEAVPSIASVSRFTLRSRPAGALTGTEVFINASKFIHQREIGMAYGTRIEVASLFHPVPARLKFLKTDNTEAAHITRLTRLYAVAHPGVGFRLVEDGDEIFRSPSSDTLIERVREIWGGQLANDLSPLPPVETAGMRLYGLLGKPGAGRMTRQEMVTIVNGRPVDSRTLAYALVESYHTLLPKGRYPLAFLFLEIDPHWIDVNVHPAKREIRFRDEPRVRNFVITAVLNHLETQHPARLAASTASAPVTETAPAAGQARNEEDGSGTGGPPKTAYAPEDPDLGFRAGASSARIEALNAHLVQPAAAAPQSGTGGSPVFPQPALPPQSSSADDSLECGTSVPLCARTSVPRPDATAAHSDTDIPSRPADAASPAAAPPSAPAPAPVPAATTPATAINFRPDWRLAGRLADGHLLFETPQALVVLNHRAARERIWYERVLGGFGGGAIPSQRLLFPVPLELDPLASSIFREHGGVLAETGFVLEEFGRNFFRIEAVPEWFGGGDTDVTRFIRDTLAELGRRSGEFRRAHLLHDFIAKTAARHAGNSATPLSDAAIPALLRDLFFCRQPTLCPSGHPIFLEFTRAELHRRFNG